MITVKEFGNRRFKSRKELLGVISENKETLLAAKSMATKFSDPVAFNFIQGLTLEGETIKAIAKAEGDPSKLNLMLAINSTNIIDSHLDLHLPKMWNKSLKERPFLYLLQEHKMQFDSIISDQVKASAQNMSWSDLGAPYPGATQVLMFKTVVDKERNPYMFEQYRKGYVKNHSVGMRYIRLGLALNSDSEYDKEEKDNWDKYLKEAVNPEVAEHYGFFYIVHEAKVIEGSAVPLGSNTITPVVSMEAKEAAQGGTSDHTEGSRGNPPSSEAKSATIYDSIV